MEVEHVKAHRTKKEIEKMTQFERFVTKGNEKAVELAKAGAMMDEGFMAEAKAETGKQEREDVYVALQYAASFHCLVEEWKDCEELEPKPWDSVRLRTTSMQCNVPGRYGPYGELFFFLVKKEPMVLRELVRFRSESMCLGRRIPG